MELSQWILTVNSCVIAACSVFMLWVMCKRKE